MLAQLIITGNVAMTVIAVVIVRWLDEPRSPFAASASPRDELFPLMLRLLTLAIYRLQ
jgi:hypothetical protein